jgi:hypothetical protein
LKNILEHKELPKILSERGGISYTNARKKEVSECRSSLHPSEKELLEWRSSAFGHKNTPSFRSVNILNFIEHKLVY